MATTYDFTETKALIERWRHEWKDCDMRGGAHRPDEDLLTRLEREIDDSYAKATGNDPETVKGTYSTLSGRRFVDRIVAEFQRKIDDDT